MIYQTVAAMVSRRLPAFVRRACILFVAAVLVGCGGGGGGGGGSEGPPQQELSITVQPTDQTSLEGGRASFVVVASGQVTYQWQRLQGSTWTDIAGATLAGFTTGDLLIADSGSRYRVIVSSAGNSANSLTSSIATLTVTAVVVPPAIAVEPVDLTLVAGQSGTFSVTATGTSLRYVWQRQSGNAFIDIAGATDATLALSTVADIDNGARFRVLVSNAMSSVSSQEVQLFVQPAPAVPLFTLEPQPVTAVAGQVASFTAAVTGRPAPTLAWQTSIDGQHWTDIAGQGNASLATAPTTASDDGRLYRAVATNPSGSVSSAAARLTVVPAPVAPTIQTQPVETTVGLAGSPTFGVIASGSPSVSYQWQVSLDGGTQFSNINGATQASYTVVSVTLGDDLKRFRVVVSNSAGTAISNAVALRVVPGPAITRDPVGQAWTPGQTEPLFTVATVGTDLSYQWQISQDGNTFTNVPGATAPSYVHAGSASDSTQRVRVLVSNAYSTTTSNSTYLTRLRWGFANPRPSGDSLFGLHWVDGNTVVAVGDSSNIYRSTDAGLHWGIVSEGDWNGAMLFDVAFQGNTGIAVGWSGTIKRSPDGGRHWTNVQTSGTSRHLYAVAFNGTSTAVAVGDNGTILRSVDGGESWMVAVNSGSVAALRDVTFRAGIGIAVGDSGTVLRSIDGGAHWAPVSSGSSNSLSGVTFATDEIVVAVGEAGILLRSTDVGLSWQPVASGTSLYLSSVSFANGSLGVAMGTQGKPVRTLDGGVSWSPVGVGALDLDAIEFSDANVAVGVGALGRIRRSVDGGITWTDVFAGARADLHGVAFATPDIGVAVGSLGTILRSVDGGNQWSTVAAGTASQLTAVAFADAATGVAVGEAGIVVRTADAGAHWTPVTSGINQPLYGVAFASPTVGAIVSGFGIVRTTDGGATWQPATGGQLALYGVAFGGSGVGLAVGANGAIVRSADGGQSWHAVPSGTTQTLQAVGFVNATTALAVGWNGSALRSTDGGQTWSPASSLYSNYIFNSITFNSGGIGLTVGSFATILPTWDAGLSWGADQSQKSAVLYGVAFAGPTTAIAVGAGGVIMRATY